MHFNVIFKLDHQLVSGPNTIMKMKIFKFYFHFCLQYAITIPLYDFDFSVLKKILQKTLLIGFYSARCTYYFPWFQSDIADHSPFLGYPYIFLFKLCLFMYLTPYLSCCIRNFIRDYQHSKHP